MRKGVKDLLFPGNKRRVWVDYRSEIKRTYLPMNNLKYIKDNILQLLDEWDEYGYYHFIGKGDGKYPRVKKMKVVSEPPVLPSSHRSSLPHVLPSSLDHPCLMYCPRLLNWGEQENSALKVDLEVAYFKTIGYWISILGKY